MKDLKGQVADLTGSDHARPFTSLCDELKTYCHALDFNDVIALHKLRGALEEAHCCNEMATLVALWERLNYLKQSGRPVDLRATIFASLATEAELEADKLVRQNERTARQNQSCSPPALDANGVTGVQAMQTVEEVLGANAIPMEIQGTTLTTAPNISHVTKLSPRNLKLNKPCHFQGMSVLSVHYIFLPHVGPQVWWVFLFRFARLLHPGSKLLSGNSDLNAAWFQVVG